MIKKPIVGISSSLIIEKDKEFFGQRKVYSNKDYIDSVIEAGGIPMIIPFSENKDVIRAQVETIDALLLTGGEDVFPYNYGQEPHPKLGEVFPKRDEYDAVLLKEAKKRGIPILGVCRGLQIINAFEGGTLYQDMSLIKGDVLKHWQNASMSEKTLKIKIEEGSILSKIYPSEIMINSFHHQAIKDIAEGYKVIASSSDGVIKAIEKDDYSFLVGVQWHPEMLNRNCEEAKKIFKFFISQASSK